ncbi:MAG TPA: hypothetical protein VNQ76_10355, partial [Planctomicrobium sp.]|nr:hypothetical protein [Planctomicrobium sp.]
RPVFSVTHAQLSEPPSTMGGGDRHLSLKIRQGERILRCVAFGKGDWAAEINQANGPLDLCFSASINQFRGYENVELQLHDWRPSETVNSNGTTMSSAV